MERERLQLSLGRPWKGKEAAWIGLLLVFVAPAVSAQPLTAKFCRVCREYGEVCIRCGEKAMRLYPNYVITKQMKTARAVADKLAETKDSCEAARLLYDLVAAPFNDCDEFWFARIRALWEEFGHGKQWLDWWLCQLPEPPSPRHWSWRLVFEERRAAGALWELKKRPRLLRRLCQARLYVPARSSSRHAEKYCPLASIVNLELSDADVLKDDQWFKGVEIDSFSGYFHDYGTIYCGQFHAHPQHVLSLKETYYLLGHTDLAAKVTARNWRQHYIWLYRWVRRNREYLKFDSERCQFVLDSEALTSRRPLPESARVVTAPVKPWPDWKGEPP